MQAIIPAAGLGKRLRPLTNTKPKVLVSVAGKPMICHIIDALLQYNIKDIVIIIGYLGEKVKEYLTKHYRGINFHFVIQEEMKGSAHAVGLARPYIREPCVIVYGDTIFSTDLKKAFSVKGDGALGIKIVNDPRRFGIVEKEGEKIVKLVEKPNYIKRSEALVGVNFIRNYNLLFNCIDELIEKGIKIKGEYYLTDAFQLMVEHGAYLTTFNVKYWFDCGTFDALIDTNRALLKLKQRYKKPIIRNSNIIIPPVVIGKNCKIKNSIIGPYASVGDNVKINNAIIRDSIVGDNSEISNQIIEKSVVGDNVILEGKNKSLFLGDFSKAVPQ